MEFTIDNELLEVFYEEVNELTSNLENSLLELEKQSNNKELINEIFRILHTIKGSCALVGFNKISDFIHKIETIYSSIRDGKFEVKNELISLTLKANDYIKALIEDIDKLPENELKSLLEKIYAVYNLKLEKPEDEKTLKKEEPSLETNDNIEKYYKIEIIPEEDFFIRGVNIEEIFKSLRQCGEIAILCFNDKVPELSEIKVENCYFYWKIFLKTNKNLQDIKNIFLFLHSNEFKIEEISNLEEQNNIIKLINKDKTQINKYLLSKPENTKHIAHENYLKVPEKKLDILLDYVGELVFAHNRLSLLSEKYKLPELTELSENLKNIMTELRNTTLEIRMVQIGNFFNKFKRIVRDLAVKLNKKVEFITEGASTELDKSIIEGIINPITHILRNSIDHGIEYPEERISKNKPETGKIIFKAEHLGRTISITISDDGKGIDLEKVKEKAINMGLIGQKEDLTDNDLIPLIFHPGLSTSSEVSDVSGRGVGMDVVKKDLKKVGGDIIIKTEKDKGTEIKIILPLTLAIIEGIIVKVESHTFVIPMEFIVECVEYIPDRNYEQEKGKVINIRDKIIPFLRLREFFNISNELSEYEEIIIVNVANSIFGIAVDKISGTRQVVIKNFGPFLTKLKCFSGATINGDGSIAFILDVISLYNEIKK